MPRERRAIDIDANLIRPRAGENECSHPRQRAEFITHLPRRALERFFARVAEQRDDHHGEIRLEFGHADAFRVGGQILQRVDRDTNIFDALVDVGAIIELDDDATAALDEVRRNLACAFDVDDDVLDLARHRLFDFCGARAWIDDRDARGFRLDRREELAAHQEQRGDSSNDEEPHQKTAEDGAFDAKRNEVHRSSPSGGVGVGLQPNFASANGNDWCAFTNAARTIKHHECVGGQRFFEHDPLGVGQRRRESAGEPEFDFHRHAARKAVAHHENAPTADRATRNKCARAFVACGNFGLDEGTRRDRITSRRLGIHRHRACRCIIFRCDARDTRFDARRTRAIGAQRNTIANANERTRLRGEQDRNLELAWINDARDERASGGHFAWIKRRGLHDARHRSSHHRTLERQTREVARCLLPRFFSEQSRTLERQLLRRVACRDQCTLRENRSAACTIDFARDGGVLRRCLPHALEIVRCHLRIFFREFKRATERTLVERQHRELRVDPLDRFFRNVELPTEVALIERHERLARFDCRAFAVIRMRGGNRRGNPRGHVRGIKRARLPERAKSSTNRLRDRLGDDKPQPTGLRRIARRRLRARVVKPRIDTDTDTDERQCKRDPQKERENSSNGTGRAGGRSHEGEEYRSRPLANRVSATFRSMAEALTDADIKKIAKLSRLSLPDSQVGQVRTQLSSILGHIAKLQALPTEGVEPMAHPMKIVNRLGADEPKACMPVEELLKNAPAVEDRYLAVPKVLGEGGGA